MSAPRWSLSWREALALHDLLDSFEELSPTLASAAHRLRGFIKRNPPEEANDGN